MTPEQFCYWLQGFAEIHQDQPNGQEWLIIMDHLAQIFRKETPERKKSMFDLAKEFEESQDKAGKRNWPMRPWDTPPDIIC